MLVRRTLRRAVGVTALTAVALTATPAFVGTAAALSAPTSVTPADGATAGARPVVSATYGAALDKAATEISVTTEEDKQTRLAGTKYFSADGKTVGFTLTNALDDDDNGFEVTVVAVPAAPADLPVHVHQWQFDVDSTPPAAPTAAVSPGRSNSTVTVSGQTEPNATVSVSLGNVTGGATPVTKDGVATATGAYTVPGLSIAGLADGAIRATVHATDVHLNRSLTAGTGDGVKDTAAPVRLSTVPAAGSTSKSRTITDVRFDEALAPSSSISVKNGVGSTLAGTTTFSPDLRTITFTSASPMTPLGGVFTVTTTAVDDLGNSAVSSSTFSIDDTAPGAPTAQLTDPVNEDNAAQAVVSGTAEPGATVEVSVVRLDDLGEPTGAPATASGPAHASTGAYSVPVDVRPLGEGRIRATVTAVDQAGNRGDGTPSNVAVKDTVDPAQPTVAITTPIDATRAATVSGTADPGTKVAISVDDTDATTAPVKAQADADGTDGKYSAPINLSGLRDGTVTVTVTANDAAGNASQPNTATGDLDTGLPASPTLAMPTVNAANAAAVAASGNADPGTTVTVTVSDGTHEALTRTTTAAGQTGAYTVTFDTTSLDDGTLTVTAVAQDAARNFSAPKEILVTRDTAAPSEPAVVLPLWVNKETATGGIEVSGTAEPSSRVFARFSDGSPATEDVTVQTVTSPTGAWTTTAVLASLVDGPIAVSVVARDTAGNDSAPRAAGTQKDVVVPAAPALSLTDPVHPGNVATAAVSGTAPGATSVHVSVDDTDARTGVVPGSGPVSGGTYSVAVDLTGLSDGTLTATGYSTDEAGNRSADGAPDTALKDTTALDVTATSPVHQSTVRPPATVTATVNEPVNTAQTTLSVSDKTGAILAGATTFTNGGRTVVLTPVDTLSDAGSPYTALLTAKDSDGTDSLVAGFTFTVDTKAPAKPTISVPAVNGANVNAVPVTGVAEPGSSVAVTVSDGTKSVGDSARADAVSGAYTVTLNLGGLADGPLTGSAVATDAATNDSDPGTTTSAKDATAPAKPSLVLPAFVNAATKAAVAVSGTAEKGSSVRISVDDATPGGAVSTDAAADATTGAYTATLDLTGLADGLLTGSAVATDAAGNPSTAGESTAAKDTIPPTAPTITIANVNMAKQSAAPVTGSAEPGSSVLVTIDDSGAAPAVTESFTAAAGTGAFSYAEDVSSLADGTLTATATATDAAGNPSAPGTATAAKDTVIATPTLTVVAPHVGGGNAASVGFTGTAEPHSALTLTVEDATPGAPAVMTFSTYDETNQFLGSVDVRGLDDGELTFVLSSRDAVGNESQTAPLKRVKDTVAPAVPTSVSLATANAANKTAVPLTGVADQGSWVFFSVTDGVTTVSSPGGVRADAPGGAFSQPMDVSSLADGQLTATVRAMDDFGNESSNATATAVKDTVAPLPPTVTMADPVNAAGATSASVSGVAEPGSSVTVSVDDATAGDPVTATVPADAVTGAYGTAVDVTSLADGALTVTATAKDAAGNDSTASTDTSTKDSQAPEVPTLDTPAAVTRASRAAAPFSGTAEPGATVTVRVDDTDEATAAVVGSTTAGGTGTWSAALDLTPLADGPLSVNLSSADAVGNSLGSTTVNGPAKDSTRAFTIVVDGNPVSGAAQTVTVRAHKTYDAASAIDPAYTGTPVLSSSDTHFAGGTCAAAVDGVATCTGTTFGDLGVQTLTAASGSGQDLVSGAVPTHVQPTGLAYGTQPPATAAPGTPVTFTVVPTVGVAGASTAGYAANRVLVTTGGGTPANGTALSCPQAECSVTMSWTGRGTKTVKVVDDGSPMRSTPVATIRLPYETAVGIASSAPSISTGGSLLIGGQLADMTNLVPLAGRQVAVYRKIAPATTFTRFTTVATDEDGIWIAQVSPTRNTTYQARFLGTADHLASSSEEMLIKVAQVVTATWSRSARTVTVSGRVTPNAAGRTVYLQYKKADGTWANAAKATVTSAGSYRITKTFSTARTLRTTIGATAVNTAGFSRSYRLP